ncbi:hypothetical protein K435DRAFT_806768 [Dendrothele bispora CBS 962.96]|uniref:Uncharacterized protein n=1 Tax=Dendrothele bispora (strain CBS 962.96) TaxID=1314807 RepID=A0A4S8L784_DENBC|nr:hypothetical protein K435DRAFT_806768 [Dendrothele bispora CBS 962.96]
MPLSQTQILSNSEISVFKNWILETAIQFLLFGIHATLSVVVLCLSMTESFITILFNGFNLSDLGNIVPSPTKSIASLHILTRFNYAMSDIIVVWRAWVLFPRYTIVKVVLSVCLVGSFAGAFFDGGTAARGFLNNVNYQGTTTEVIILIVPLLFTNLVATVLIGYKTWCHRRDIQNILENTGSSSKVQKILLLLVESAVLYFAIWFGYFLAEYNVTGLELSFEVCPVVMGEIAAIYPLLVILVVARENAKPDSLENTSLSQSIRFASVEAASSHTQGSVAESQVELPID